jgi:hypothetical protein
MNIIRGLGSVLESIVGHLMFPSWTVDWPIVRPVYTRDNSNIDVSIYACCKWDSNPLSGVEDCKRLRACGHWLLLLGVQGC